MNDRWRNVKLIPDSHRSREDNLARRLFVIVGLTAFLALLFGSVSACLYYRSLYYLSGSPRAGWDYELGPTAAEAWRALTAFFIIGAIIGALVGFVCSLEACRRTGWKAKAPKSRNRPEQGSIS